MSLFACCFWWFVFGVLLGWLLNWWLSSIMRKDPPASGGTAASFASPSASTAAPAAVPAPPVKPAGIDMAAAALAGFSLKSPDDLTIIEGIGPKINALFNEHGVHTFAQLAKMSVPEMAAILDKGGARFKLANPGSWAQQAQLAADNRWTELKTLQDKLYAGVDLVDEDDDGNKKA
jgi:predicted flap endonuclease-1-like 5' DNA nuclease